MKGLSMLIDERLVQWVRPGWEVRAKQIWGGQDVRRY